MCYMFFFFNDTATTEIYTLSLHDALPIYSFGDGGSAPFTLEVTAIGECSPLTICSASRRLLCGCDRVHIHLFSKDRKSTRLNSSHLVISYAVFCLKKKKIHTSLYILTLNT